MLVSRSSSHASTSGCVLGRMNSVTTLVSRMIIVRKLQSNRGGSCIGSLEGISSSTPAKGLNSSWRAVPRFLAGGASSSSADRKMSRASCSIDRPFSAARMRSRRFSPSARLRIVMLAHDCASICSVARLWHDWFAIETRPAGERRGGYPDGYGGIAGGSRAFRGGTAGRPDAFAVGQQSRFGCVLLLRA